MRFSNIFTTFPAFPVILIYYDEYKTRNVLWEQPIFIKKFILIKQEKNMATNIAINGFGKIGDSFLMLWLTKFIRQRLQRRSSC